ncbi:Amino acid transporter, transmembrane domain [Dillenia turbinata]|uniref:Amino acid transporter, transmembrane domain n=1 Tax=Dillenia turbinata TaxID=194707 RepID=A0AAN8W531_9MAGN
MLPRSRTMPVRFHHGSMDESRDTRHYLQVEVQPKRHSETEAMNPQANYSKCFDDDGRLKRTGTFWTASSHIITAVIGSGVLSLAWAVGQLGWVTEPLIMILFALANLYTANLLAQCYRSGDPVTGPRNYTYMDAVKAYLGIFYPILLREKGHCLWRDSISKFGWNCNWIYNCSLSQYDIPDFDQVWWLSIVAAIMSFTYSTVGLGLGVAKAAGTVTEMQKVWRSMQALGAIAFAYSFSIILIEIQDTIKSPPVEHKTMKKATLFSVTLTTIFYLLCGCFGYAAFGDEAPGNLLTGFGFYNPYWLLDIANLAIVVHLVGAYQVYCQPLFAFVEKWSTRKWSKSNFITEKYDIPVPFFGEYQLNFFRLVWRTAFVVVTTVTAMLLPFFNDVVGILGALGFWPLTVYFPVEMYISQKRIAKWTTRWLGLQLLSMTCLVISVAAAVGSVAGVVLDLKTYKPFKTS